VRRFSKSEDRFGFGAPNRRDAGESSDTVRLHFGQTSASDLILLVQNGQGTPSNSANGKDSGPKNKPSKSHVPVSPPRFEAITAAITPHVTQNSGTRIQSIFVPSSPLLKSVVEVEAITVVELGNSTEPGRQARQAALSREPDRVRKTFIFRTSLLCGHGVGLVSAVAGRA
jgi:hypothetical protein